ncbi:MULTISPECIES: hypothetical protein [unclassified Streptomyces]|nr:MULTISPECIES: hypothetical protein [unclassified Streptomyces]
MVPHSPRAQAGLVDNGYSCRGEPPIEELRRDLRQVTREIRPN